jgi:hypothetical protein
MKRRKNKMTFLIVLAPIVGIVAVIAMMAALARKEGENFEKRIRAIYYYIVAFSTLIMTIVGIIGAVVKLTDIIIPERYNYENYTEETLVDVNYNNRIRNIKEGIKYYGVVVVSLPVFVYHSRKARELKED